jgi:sugar phosphate isomerase/epimerase
MAGMIFTSNRRNFLRGGAIAAAAACLPLDSAFPGSTAFAAETKTSAIRLGVASYSFRKFDRKKVIESMKQLETPYLNVKDVHLPMGSPEEIKAGSAEFAAAGIKLTAAGTIYFLKDEDEDVKSKFEYCRLAGIPTIVAGPTIETLPRVEKFAKAYDIKIAIHNHGPEDKHFPSPLDVLNAVKNMDPRIGLCIDVGHTERAGVDVVEAIHKAGPRLFDVHIKDLADLHVKESQVAVGDGKIPIPGIFTALEKIGYPGYVDLEYEIHPEDPLPGMIKSFAYMRGVLAGMQA